jgi:hypothetical protein
MGARQVENARTGRCSSEYAVLLLLVVLVVTIATARLTGGDHPPEPRPLWSGIVAALVGLLQCFGLFLGASLILAALEFAKQTWGRCRQGQVERKLERLQPLLSGENRQVSMDMLKRVVRMLSDRDAGVRQQALAAAYCLMRAGPKFAGPPAAYRTQLERALLESPGFARTLHEMAGRSLPPLVTLGAKVGAGTADKRISPATDDPAVLARWICSHRDGRRAQELQVSIGYDTGLLPFQCERGKFLALFFYLVTTNLKRFQALTRRPARDPNAAFGLLIRGDVVEVRYPGQSRGRRLDYVFPLQARWSRAKLTRFLRRFQLLNLGLLLAALEDTCRIFFPGRPPTWLDTRARAAARTYRRFERNLVALLREFDAYRDPCSIHRLQIADHAERVRAFRTHRLEECLYPQYAWVVPLYGHDASWDRLLAPLRAVEGMILHQGEVYNCEETRGRHLIRRARKLGSMTVANLEEAMEYPELATDDAPPDPFLDGGDEEATRDYLRCVGQALARGHANGEDLPDLATFRKAAAYYQIESTSTTLV